MIFAMPRMEKYGRRNVGKFLMRANKRLEILERNGRSQNLADELYEITDQERWPTPFKPRDLEALFLGSAWL